jgi:hypothetical protein
VRRPLLTSVSFWKLISMAYLLDPLSGWYVEIVSERSFLRTRPWRKNDGKAPSRHRARIARKAT